MADESTSSDHHTSQIDEFPLESDGDGLVSLSIPTQTGVGGEGERAGKRSEQRQVTSSATCCGER